MRRLCHHKSESQIQIRISQKIEELYVKEAEIVESGLDVLAPIFSPTPFFFA